MPKKLGGTGNHPLPYSAFQPRPLASGPIGAWPLAELWEVECDEAQAPLAGTSCGFTLEQPSWVEAAGEDCQRMGIWVAQPAGPVSRAVPKGLSRPRRLPGSVGASWQLRALHGPGPPGLPHCGKGQRGDMEVVSE